MNWIPINNFPDYDISDLGCIRSRKRGKVKYLTAVIFRKYLGVYLFKDGKKHVKYIHKLVAEHFLGEPEGRVVRHLDGDIYNNELNNLAYGTQLDNMADAERHGTIARGTDVPQAKLNPRKVRIIRGLRKCGFTVPRLSEIFGVNIRNIYRVLRRETWAHVV